MRGGREMGRKEGGRESDFGFWIGDWRLEIGDWEDLDLDLDFWSCGVELLLITM